MALTDRPININITSQTIIKIIVILVLLFFLYFIRDILAVFFIALIFSTALDSPVDWLAKRRVNRSVSTLLIFLVFFAVISLIVYLIIPPIITELSQLSANFPFYFNKINSLFNYFSTKNEAPAGLVNNISSALGSLNSALQTAASSLFSTVTAIFGGLVSFVLIMVLIFYMVAEENAMKKLIWSLMPVGRQSYAINLIERMQKKVSLWLKGQLILIVALFVFLYVGFLILHLNYALILALFVAVAQVIPFFGPIIGAFPVFILAYIQSPWLCLFVAIFYLIVQTIENNILVPKIMEKTVGLNPIVVIFVLLSGWQIAGVVGAIISLPLATAASVFIKDYFNNKERQKRIKEEAEI